MRTNSKLFIQGLYSLSVGSELHGSKYYFTGWWWRSESELLKKSEKAYRINCIKSPCKLAATVDYPPFINADSAVDESRDGYLT